MLEFTMEFTMECSHSERAQTSGMITRVVEHTDQKTLALLEGM